MGVHMIDEETLRIFLINHRPQADPNTYGANSTIELFESTLGSDAMRHIKTYADEVIMTPNDLTPTGPDSFVFSNDHHIKVGHLKVLDLFTARTSVGRCDNKGCKKVVEPYKYPNGITGVSRPYSTAPSHELTFSLQGTQFPNPNPNLIYIASSAQNLITVVESQADGSVVKVRGKRERELIVTGR